MADVANRTQPTAETAAESASAAAPTATSTSSAPSSAASTAVYRRWEATEHTGSGALHIVDSPSLPVPKAGEVLVRVLATDATYTDVLILRGNYPDMKKLPVTPGYALIGDVIQVGPDVRGLAVGDRVASMPQHGGAATHIVLRERLCVKIRSDVDPADAVSIVLTGTTAYQMLHRAAEGRVRPGATLLVHGCTGGTGAMVVELAKLAGVEPTNIFGTCATKNAAAASAMGIRVFPYDAPAAPWDDAVLHATENRGVDVVFDHVFIDGYMRRGMRCLARGGKYIAYGFTNASAPGSVNIAYAAGAFARLFAQNYVLSWFDQRPAEFFNVAHRRDLHPDEFAADVREMLGMLADHRLKPLVGRVWPFEGVRDALQSIEQNRHTGKQIIRIA